MTTVDFDIQRFVDEQYGTSGDDNLTNSGNEVIIYGLEGNDTISNSGSAVTIDGGYGNDYISLNSASSANVIRYTNGADNDTVVGFSSDDTLKISSNSFSTTASGNDVIVNVGSGSVILRDVSSFSPNIVQADDYTLFLEPGQSENIWLSGYDLVNNVAAAWGNNTLSNIDSSNNEYSHILAGNDLSNQIVAGNGSTTLWGGTGGDDTLVGGDSRDVFVYADGEGNDVAANFKAGVSENSDIVALLNGIGDISRDGDTIIINGTSEGALVIETDLSEDESILFTTDGENISAAKIAGSENTLYYDKNVSYFQFSDNAGTVYYMGDEDVSIAFDNSAGQTFLGSKNINAEGATGNLNLVGNSMDNEIRGGAGNDTLTGGIGADTFYWGSGCGNDLITDVGDDDLINLENVTLSDVSDIDTSNGIKITLNDGSQLQVNGNNQTFQLADNARWQYTEGNWQQK